MAPDCPGACCGPVHDYTQCHLRKTTATGVARMTSWIPSQFAVAGKTLMLWEDYLDDGDGDWDDGWVVESVGVTRPGRDREEGVLCDH